MEDVVNAKKANEQLQEYATRNNIEIKKGNENVTQLLQSTNQLKEKISVKNDVIKTQEGVINGLKQEELNLKDSLSKLQSELQLTKRREDTAHDEVELLKKKIHDAKNVIEQQSNVSEYSVCVVLY